MTTWLAVLVFLLGTALAGCCLLAGLLLDARQRIRALERDTRIAELERSLGLAVPGADGGQRPLAGVLGALAAAWLYARFAERERR